MINDTQGPEGLLDFIPLIEDDRQIRFVISTGDITHMGEREQLEKIQRDWAASPVPIYATLGNPSTFFRRYYLCICGADGIIVPEEIQVSHATTRWRSRLPWSAGRNTKVALVRRGTSAFGSAQKCSKHCTASCCRLPHRQSAPLVSDLQNGSSVSQYAFFTFKKIQRKGEVR